MPWIITIIHVKTVNLILSILPEHVLNMSKLSFVISARYWHQIMTTHAQNKTTVRNNINVISSCSNLLFIMIKQHVRFPLYLPCAAVMSKNSTKIHLLAEQWRWKSLAQFQHKNLQKLCLLWSASAGQTTPLVSHSWIKTKASVSGSSKMRKGMLTTSTAEHQRTGSPSKTDQRHKRCMLKSRLITFQRI